MDIIFCSNPLSPSKIDSEWNKEYRAAKNNQLSIHIFNYESFLINDFASAFKNINLLKRKELCIYRGWMLTRENYQILYEKLLDYNLQLINSPQEYEYCYYLPESYNLIKQYTPDTVVYSGLVLPKLIELGQLLSKFGNNPIIVKDYVKSQKHYWNEACYIQDASNTEHAYKIVKKFVKLQGDNFQGGLVFRKFLEQNPIGFHPKSKMPLAKEYRVFILNGEPIAVNKYWDGCDYYDNDILPLKKFRTLFKEINSNFFTVDIAQTKGGDWIIIELGDGQVAEYMDNKSLNDFYQTLAL